MRETTTIFLVAVITILLAVASACSTERAEEQLPDPDTVTLEQVLEYSRAAMSEVTSYRANGTQVRGSSEQEPSTVSMRLFEQQAFDHYRVRVDLQGDKGNGFTEKIGTGMQVFQRDSDRGWWETHLTADQITSIRSNWNQISIPDNGHGQIISRDEVTPAGVRVYPVESVGRFEIPPGNTTAKSHDLQIRTVTFLIDHETFRLITRITKYQFENINLSGSTDSLVATREWSQTINTEQFFDYDETIEIEAPDEYTPSQELTAFRISR